MLDKRIEDVILELHNQGHSIVAIHILVNFYEDGSRVRDVNGNVVPEVTIAFIGNVVH